MAINDVDVMFDSHARSSNASALSNLTDAE